MDKAIIAVRGLAGWYECGRTPHGQFSRSAPGGLAEKELTAPLRYDLSEALARSSNPAMDIWRRASLDLSLPDGHVRSMFEGCIGCGGSLDGHPWDGDLNSIHSTDSVGLHVYQAILEAYGVKKIA